MKIATVLRSAMATEILDAIDASVGNPGEVEFYTGTMPATMGLAITDTLLVTIPLVQPAGAVTAGVFTATEVDAVVGAADGDAGWCRIVDGAGTEVTYLAVGITGSGASVEMNSIQVVTGVAVKITALSFTIAGY